MEWVSTKTCELKRFICSVWAQQGSAFVKYCKANNEVETFFKAKRKEISELMKMTCETLYSWQFESHSYLFAVTRSRTFIKA